ncbi:MAG: VOC family protein [Rhodoglobus sp.]
MFTHSAAYSGFSVRDTEQARDFYESVLGLTVGDAEMPGIISIELATGGTVIAYPKGDHHVPASFTVLNFPVDDVDGAVDELVAKGIEMLRYEGMHQDDKGISRGKAAGMGPDIAWFTDPSGNILSVHSL